MQVLAHPLLRRDIEGLAEHVHAVSGSADAARRRLREVHDLIEQVIENPSLGTSVGEALPGWRVRHGGRGRRITLVFRHDAEADEIHLALVSFGGEDWANRSPGRTTHFPDR
ncbi:type II toxin-antitoxin system RelE/ParE family toxin [Paracoccus benzoatiresistens]|uniref:type II toxin-antitoxin system RelE/ParE family toxin n=1 Tax=Paracoccus benzoatiresistens TaxID=2997341 RepID=UPI00352FF684